MGRSTVRRGLQIMRTQGTRKAGALSSPEMYIRLTSLEMERARRVLERDRLMERVKVLEERISKIGQEQAEMRSRIDTLDQQHQANSDHPQSQTRQEPGFGFTY